ncbi:MAG TPA: radical SAM protein [Smithella sp.]|nr:radical SAM protein [Smithella sp.]
MKNINVLMIQPKTPQTFWSHDHTIKALGFKTTMPPLGLLTVAAMLPKNFNIKLVDLNVENLDMQDVENSDMVFLTGMIVNRESFIELVNLCQGKGKTVVAGGPFVQSIYGTKALDNLEVSKIEHLIIYEAENNLPQFLEDFAQGNAKKVYDNKDKPPLTQTPTPRFDLIRPGDYASMALQFSRGCPFNCEFCDIVQMFGHIPRTKTPEQFMSEVEALYSTGYRGRLFIVDDNFIANRKKVKEMLRLLAAWQEERGYPFLLFTEASIDLARDDELLGLMRRSGFTSVFIGIESPDADTLRATKKNQNVTCDMNAAIEKVQKAGIEVMGGFILGFDTDTDDVFDNQLEFIRRNSIVQSMVGLLAAMPHTDLYNRLEREGRLVFGLGHSGNNVDTDLNFIPKMPAKQLIAGYRRVIKETYAPRNYFARAATLLKKFPDMRLSKLKHAEPWQKKLYMSKMTIHPNKAKLIFELMKLVFNPFGIYGLIFIIKSLRFGLLSTPVTIELTFRGLHYMSVAREIENAAD